MRIVDADEILTMIDELKTSPWYLSNQNNFERIIKKEAVEIVRDCCVKEAKTVEQIRQGQWIVKYRCSSCSECDATFEFEDVDDKFEFCPSCGAKMVEEVTE